MTLHPTETNHQQSKFNLITQIYFFHLFEPATYRNKLIHLEFSHPNQNPSSPSSYLFLPYHIGTQIFCPDDAGTSIPLKNSEKLFFTDLISHLLFKMKPSSFLLCLIAGAAVSAAAAPHSGSLPKIVLDESDTALPKLSVNRLTAADNEPSNLGPDSEVNDRASFLMAVSMIVVSEIGDKTFLIAALMAMKHLKWVVFSAGYSSLVVMTVLLGIVGHALPTLISQRVTQFLASVLFLVFGFKLTKEGLAMSKEAGVDEELAEVEEELLASNMNVELDELEGGHGRRPSFSHAAKNQPWYKALGPQVANLASFVLSPVWIQVFVMTFLGEWGDRSQIATIAMAAGSDYWFVILGAIVGHGVCTAAACIGGQLLATRISMRNVTLGGAAAFFVFSVLYFYDFYTNASDGELPQ